MTRDSLRLGYLPLIDAAPLVIAQELGFAAEEGLNLDLIRLQSWAQSRDMLGTGGIDAAQMLVPLPVAQAMGLGPMLPAFDLLMILSQGGQAIAVSAGLQSRFAAAGHDIRLDDPVAARAALQAAGPDNLRVGVPFPFSTQAELVRHWLDGSPLRDRLAVHTVPPPQMSDALASGEIDAFCVGEPWASYAVEAGVGALVLTGTAIWAAPPEKGLVVTRDFAEGRPDLTGRLMRAVWRSCRWLDRTDNRSTAAEILSRPGYLNLPPELSERGLLGRLIVTPRGDLRQAPGFIRFHDGAANFPWRSLAALFARSLAQRHGLGAGPAADEAIRRATAAFRTDLYRLHLREAGADLPGASARVEGAMGHPTAVSSEKGRMILAPDRFFDGQVFDPGFSLR